MAQRNQNTGIGLKGPLAFLGKEGRGFSALCSHGCRLRKLPGLLLAAALAFSVLTQWAWAATPFTNQARLTYNSSGAIDAAVTVFGIAPTQSQTTLMQYAPTLSGAQMVQVPGTVYSDDGTTSGVGLPVGAAYAPGSTSPIDISGPVPLVDSQMFHQGEPLFIRIEDGDQNLDPAAVESIWVQATSSVTGDAELLLLTETAPDSGVYMGYIQTSSMLPPAPGNGVLDVATADTITVAYTDMTDLSDTSQGVALVDPLGLVFDSRSGDPVDGVTLTLVDAASGAPALVLGDDGISTFPAAIVSGGTVTDSSGKVYDFEPGRYRYPFVPPGDYRIVIAPPSGYAAPSAVPTADLAALPGGPFMIADPGSRGEVFVLNPGPVVRMDIPVDPFITGLWLRKSVNLGVAAIGDFAQYTVSLEKSADSPDSQVTLTDRLPLGFHYRSGSARVSGRIADDPQISSDGRSLNFDLGLLSGAAAVDVKYVVEIGAGTPLGKARNSVWAAGTGGLASNTASADITIKEDLFRSKNFIVGRVIINNCGDQPTEEADGLAGARIYLENGTYTITDDHGRYHFEGLDSGTHVVQLDLESLEQKYEVSSCEENTRFSGTPFSQFVELHGGTLWRADFHLNLKPRAVGSVQLQLNSTLIDGNQAEYRLVLQGTDVPLRNLRLTVRLPQGALYQANSATADQQPISEPRTAGRELTFALGDRPEGFDQVVVFRARLPIEGPSEELTTKAFLTFDTPGLGDQSTPAVENLIRRNSTAVRLRQPNVILGANFDILDSDLSDTQKKEMDPLLTRDENTEVVHVIVKGYTDNLPISERNRHIYLDNFDLSRARAQNVVDYLSERLDLTDDQITLIGMGPDDPLGDNNTDQGRAENRRVHVELIREATVFEKDLSIAKDTDKVKVDTMGLRPGEQWAENSGKESPLLSGHAGAAGQDDGILAPLDNSMLVSPINAVRIQLDSRLKPQLSLDGHQIPAEKIGFKLKDPVTGKSIYTYMGVDFGAPGKHILSLSGLGPFGNARFNQEITLLRTGEIETIRQLPFDENVADGQTAVKIALELLDAAGRPIHAPVELELKGGTLQLPLPDKPHGLAVVEDSRIKVDASGMAVFRPVTQSGRHWATLAYSGKTITVETLVKPKLRDWILVGLAQGTAGYSTVSGNMENLTASDAPEDLYTDGRLAFFAKGKVKGSWLITAAYDSRGEEQGSDRKLFQTINPATYYTLYGDATNQQYEASSIRQIYLKIEREQFYALFGDYNTDMTVTELSRYSRSFNGLKSEYNGEKIGFTFFATDTQQGFVKDEMQGDGTSGLYRLSRNRIVINSEKVTIETRDRYRSEIIVASQNLTRYVDYTIDYDAGTLFFKSPVFSRDEAFNPIFIVVDYETEYTGETAYNYGGRGAVKFLDKRLETGATYIHEGPDGAESNLGGLDVRYDLGNGFEAKAEVAATTREVDTQNISGQAYLAEIGKNAETYDARVYFREQEPGFGLGQQNNSETSMLKYGADGAWRFKEDWTLRGEVLYNEQLATQAKRHLGDVQLEYRREPYNFFGGLRLVEDSFSDGTVNRSDQLLAGVARSFMDQRLKLRLEHAQSIGGNNASDDYPTRTQLGADYQLTPNVGLFANQEFTFGENRNTASTRMGLKATPWSGGQLSSSMGRNLTEDSDRLFANLGLYQTWRLNEHWTLDGGLDLSRSVTDAPDRRINPRYPVATGPAIDFTAISLGAGYDALSWSWVGRMEHRWAEDRDKWDLVSGIAGEVRKGLGLSAGLQVFQENIHSGADSFTGDLKLSGAWRPDHNDWIVFDRLEYKFDRLSDSASDVQGQRIVNNLNANYKPQQRLQCSLQYGAKYVFDTIDERSYSGFTDLIGVETRYDLTRRWDLGLALGMLHGWDAGQLDYRTGLSVGYALFKNAWVSLGYNFLGYTDQDFSAADFTAQGPYLKFRIKVDQQSVKEMVSWFDRR